MRVDKEEKLEAEEKIMDAVCDLCHWPFAYQDEDVMLAERCECCLARAAVEEVLGL